MRQHHKDHLMQIGITLFVLFSLLLFAVLSNSPVIAGDTTIEYVLSGMRTPDMTSLFTWLTLLGSPITIAGVTAVGFYLCSRSRRLKRYAPALALTVVGAGLSSVILKVLVERARPTVAVVHEYSYSFPSWHATTSVALYGFLAYVLWHVLTRTSEDVIMLLVTLALILAIGFSRLYLGVHYPSDVAAGYLLGTMWLLLGVTLSKRLNIGRSR